MQCCRIILSGDQSYGMRIAHYWASAMVTIRPSSWR
jgi:hypothetical protein